MNQRAGTTFEVTIAHHISDPEARARLEEAIEAEGAAPVAARLTRLMDDPLWLPNCAAVAYDLEPIEDGGLRILRKLRAHYATVPILLYVPLKAGIAPLLLAAGRMHGVAAKAQFDDAKEPARLRAFIRRGLADVPAIEIARLITLLLPEMPSRVAEFTFAALRRITGPEWSPDITVGTIVPELGFTRRTLLRSWSDDSLPQPKELLDWLTLLFISYAASRSGLSNRAIAQARGLKLAAYYRLRRRLLGVAPETDDQRSEQEFDLALLAFAERCNVPERRIEAVRSSSGR